MAGILASTVACSTGEKKELAENNVDMAGHEISKENQTIDLDNVVNARQLGGYLCKDGRRIKDQLLLRTSQLSDISDETVKSLSEKYHVKHMIDFRMDSEKEGKPDRMIDGIQYTHISVFEPDLYDEALRNKLGKIVRSEDDEFQKMIQCAKLGVNFKMYHDILLSERAQKGYSQFFDILLNQGDGAVLWHCTYGKDRTGIASALLLYALGADEDTIRQDYVLSNEYYQNKIDELTRKAEEMDCDENVLKEIKASAGVNEEYLESTFNSVKEEYGSIHDYLNHQLGVSDEDMKKLQDKYLE